MKKQLFFLFLIQIAVSCGNSDKVQTVYEGKLKHEVVSLAPKIAGRIERIFVSESDTVHAGDTLAVLYVPELDAKLMQADGAVLSATSQYQMSLNGATQEELQQIESAYSVAVEQYKLAEKSFNRVAALYADSLISSQNYDEMNTKYLAAKSQLDGLTAKRKEVMIGVRKEKQVMAQGQKNQAQGVLKEVETAMREKYIIAPKNMTIETISLKEGELALPGYAIFVGYNTEIPFFRFTIRESELIKFKNGNEYLVDLPFLQKQLKAKLISVKQLDAYANKTTAYPNYQMGESVYELKLIPISESDATAIFNNVSATLIL